ncbi:unnamed protein product [Bursaphelenchus xylophilus]|uniref:(pine wood nematode) hypothetical protein n=1 Tax=Bursaphelenchus xylophilus TaxID=6326 RepID=A0A1I7RY36_BURXY|nr:unnamed protein product [Bursaphelenchus xylophilus]CAG9085243.1 unnamed protein product [Bursaphelenchus xylophilus]
MDVDMEVSEIRFSENLGSCSPKLRRRALIRLREYIRNQSKVKGFTPESFDRLCRGLHYALWMQDKMLLQEEMCDEFGSLVNLFNTHQEVINYMRAMILTLSKHWLNIDKWRMDKFLLMMRRIFRAFFVYLRNKKWQKDLVESSILFMRQTVITGEDSGVNETLKMHFTTIYIEELDYAGDLSTCQVVEFIEPYVDVIKRTCSDTLLKSIYTEVFMTILEGFAAELEREKGNKKVSGDLKGVGKPIEFDYNAICELLKASVESGEMNSKKKKKLKPLISQFELAAKGESPFKDIIEPDRKDPLDNDMISRAVDQLHSLESKIKKDKKKFRKVKKQIQKQKA